MIFQLFVPKHLTKTLFLFFLSFKSCFMSKYKLMPPVCSRWIHGSSVATVVTNAFRENWIMMPRNLAKTIRIIVKIEHIGNRGVTFWAKRIRQLFPTLWSGHEFGHKISQISWPLHSVGNSCPILSGQNITPRFMTCSISTNILTVLANFLGS